MSKLVAIIVPLSNRDYLSPDEQISYRHLMHFLPRYDKYAVAPKGLKISFPGLMTKHFPEKFFGSTEAHKKLLFTGKFYKAFRDYQFVLIYHLDSLVFSDQLTEWCEMGFDLIGPPWIEHPEAPYVGQDQFEGRVGSGGFSLRKIESFLNVIYSSTLYRDPQVYWSRYYASRSSLIRFLNLPKRVLKGLGLRNSARWEMSKWKKAEDSFWAIRAKHYYSEFKIAPTEVALRFGFECVPRYSFEKNNRKLPFGCHAWQRYDRDFWEPYLIK